VIARSVAIVVAASVSLGASLGGCAAAQRAAQEDPMRCERDPKCEKKRGRTADCSMQCSDDPACMERCEQVQAPNKLGH
jgi:hypothetical protein